MTQLKNVIESPCGLRFMFDQLELQSGFARRWLLDSSMMTNEAQVEACYGEVRRFVAFINQVDRTYIDTLCHKLCDLKDIRTTIRNLSGKAILDDIELFEVKHLALLASDVTSLLARHGMDDVVEIPDLDEVIGILLRHIQLALLHNIGSQRIVYCRSVLGVCSAADATMHGGVLLKFCHRLRLLL